MDPQHWFIRYGCDLKQTSNNQWSASVTFDYWSVLLTKGSCSFRQWPWKKLHPSELRCTPCELRYTPLSQGANTELRHPPELSCAAPSLATLPYSKKIRCTFVIFAGPLWSMLHPSELLWTLWASLYTAELGMAPLSCAAPSELRCTLTELPPFVHFFRMPDCPSSGQSGTGMKRMPMTEAVQCSPAPEKETRFGTGMFRYRTEMMDADAQLCFLPTGIGER
jgi:hypothetical protein